MPSGGFTRPRNTHSWVTYVKATPTPAGTVVEPVTISWYPADGRINLIGARRPEPGMNMTLHQTLQLVQGHGERVTMFGPYETDATRYQQAVAQANRLGSGAVKYKALDLGKRSPDTSPCLHAITDAAPAMAGSLQDARAIGVGATRKLLHQQMAAGAVPNPAVTHDWLIPTLGLDGYAMRRER